MVEKKKGGVGGGGGEEKVKKGKHRDETESGKTNSHFLIPTMERKG